MRGKDPKKAKPQKPKMAVFGSAGIGKSWFASDFPKAYFIDAEGGCNLPHYTDKLKKAGALYVGPEDGAGDPDVVIQEAKEASTVKHDRLTWILDSYSYLWNAMLMKEYQRLVDKGQDPEGFFGRDKKPAIAFTRKLLSWVDKMDVNAILICHSKDEWKDGKVVRQIFDGYEKMEYALNLVFHASKQGNRRVAKTVKSRFEQFPEGEIFDLSYSVFEERLGEDALTATPKMIKLATPDQVAALTALIETVRVDQDTCDKWLDKAQVDNWSEMDAESIQKCIDYLTAKLPKSAA
jgi:hypothetical protein